MYKLNNRSIIQTLLWIISIELIGFIIGSYSKPAISGWYLEINKSSLTPPNYVFPIAWTTLYALIAIAGYNIWSQNEAQISKLKLIKLLYIFQMVLNFCWSPVFFNLNRPDLAMIIILIMDISVAAIIIFAMRSIKSVSILMAPYLLWICFASYLNFYIYLNN